MFMIRILPLTATQQLVTSAGTMQINRAFAFLCLVISVGAQRNHRLTCYLDVLSRHTLEGSCTHIVLPFVSSDEDLFLRSLSEDDGVTLRKMKERNPALKILLGLEVKSSRLELMFANVGDFTQTVLKYLKDKSLDGLDVIWLDGTSSDVSSRNTELFMDILKSLKDAFEKETDPLLLSVSVLDPDDHSAVGYDEQTLSQYVDFISLLTAHLEKEGPYINKTVQRWQDKHVDLQMLSLAMPGFLRRSRRQHHRSSHQNRDAMNPEEGKKGHQHVLNSYLGNEVCQAIKNGQEGFNASFSSMQSLTEEVLQKGFGGVGLVFIDLDIFSNSMCANITQDERVIVESKMIMLSHHGHRRHGYGGHHHRQNHHHHHHHHHSSHHSSHLPQLGHHNRERHHRTRHQHGHRYHGHHHHHHHHHSHHDHSISPQSNMTVEKLQGTV